MFRDCQAVPSHCLFVRLLIHPFILDFAGDDPIFPVLQFVICEVRASPPLPALTKLPPVSSHPHTLLSVPLLLPRASLHAGKHT